MRDITGLITIAVLSTKIGEIANKILDHAKYINLVAQYLIRN